MKISTLDIAGILGVENDDISIAMCRYRNATGQNNTQAEETFKTLGLIGTSTLLNMYLIGAEIEDIDYDDDCDEINVRSEHYETEEFCTECSGYIDECDC